jgi:hypothetical protein
MKISQARYGLLEILTKCIKACNQPIVGFFVKIRIPDCATVWLNQVSGELQ